MDTNNRYKQCLKLVTLIVTVYLCKWYEVVRHRRITKTKQPYSTNQRGKFHLLFKRNQQTSLEITF